ncbi:hypothetical protein R69746_06096 [Paraburkholderia aspalathi]|nr:hypothetical protein R69746_06096 [Paraburkholderia aspalathi]
MFDFIEFDAFAGDLDLPIVATQEINGSVRATADQVTGAVELGAGGEDVVDELLRRQFGTVEVAERNAFTAHDELTHFSLADWNKLVVQNVDERARDGVADGNGVAICLGLAAARNAVAAGKGRVLGRTIAVDDLQPGMGLHDFAYVDGRQHIPASQHLLERKKGFQPIVGERVEEAGREPGARHAESRNLGGDGVKRGLNLVDDSGTATVQ